MPKPPPGGFFIALTGGFKPELPNKPKHES
jgi:hypothetical protein